MKVTSQKKLKFYKAFPCIALSGLALFGLQACGDDGASAEKESDFVSKLDDDPLSSAVTSADSQSSDSKANTDSSGSTNKQQNTQSSSSKTATASSDEILNDAKKVVTGTCAPSTPAINKGELATWAFYRENGDIFDAIMAPFVWKFPELSKTVQGNGYDKVNIEYPEPGTYTATLSVDGSEITCAPLQVQGIPITVKSCKADKETAKAGETITWTVVAESEATITGYAWSSEKGTVSGTSTTGTMTATADMHKQKIAATVAVTNNDKTTQTYLCDGVTVLDPESVDLVLALGSINDESTYGEKVLPDLPDSLFIQAQTPMTIQIPASAPTNCTVGCKPKTGSDYMSLKVSWEGEELTSFAYFNPAGCAPGKKYSVTTSVTTMCVVNK